MFELFLVLKNLKITFAFVLAVATAQGTLLTFYIATFAIHQK